MKTKKLILFLFCTTTLLFSACRKEPQTPINETELITTVKLTLTDNDAPFTVYNFTWKDIDGDGGSNPLIDSILLPVGKTFQGNILLLDERNALVDTISKDIYLNESEEHQLFYQSTPIDLISNFMYLNFDGNGKPLGTEFACKTNTTTNSGSFRVTLIHQPNKDGANVSNNDVSNANGETDIEVNFPVRLY